MVALQLVNYDVNAWEGRAYEYGLSYLRDAGCNVDGAPAYVLACLRGCVRRLVHRSY